MEKGTFVSEIESKQICPVYTLQIHRGRCAVEILTSLYIWALPTLRFLVIPFQLNLLKARFSLFSMQSQEPCMVSQLGHSN